MTDNHFADILRRQYTASLRMLRGVIEKCPDELWDTRDDEAPAWQQALHTLFYARLYLLADVRGSEAAENGQSVLRLIGEERAKPDSVGKTMWSLTKKDYRPPRVPAKQELLECLARCESSLDTALNDIASGGGSTPSPAEWIKGDRAHLLLYNLRHIQHHVGRLHGTLGRRGVKLEWQV
jgi:hypothetical protein